MTVREKIRETLEEKGYVFNRDFTEEDLKMMAIDATDLMLHLKMTTEEAIKSVIQAFEYRRKR